jgi:hypothetical protein
VDGQGHIAYWAITGVLTVFGFLGSFTIGLPFLVVGLLMCAFGKWPAPGETRHGRVSPSGALRER